MQYQVLANDYSDPEALNRRLAIRERHLKLGDEMIARGELLFAAAHLDSSGKMIGSTMIVDFSSRAALDEWLANEPYVTGQVWEKIEITQCKAGPSFSKTQSSVRLDHIAFLVHNIQETIEDYKEVFEGLGLSNVEVISNPGTVEGYPYKSLTFVSDKGETVLQFIESEHPRDKERLKKYGESLHHVEFCAENIDRTIQDLKKANIPLLQTQPVVSEDLPWQKSITLALKKTHGVLVKVTTAYEVKDGKWIPKV